MFSQKTLKTNVRNSAQIFGFFAQDLNFNLEITLSEHHQER
jgi:hypothetical protein